MSPSLLCIEIGRTLYAVVEDTKKAGIPPRDYRKLFVTEHAHNVALLLGNIGLMGHGFQAYATKLLVRPMYESMFNMIAAIREPSFAKSKMLSECEIWLKILRDYREQRKSKGEDPSLIDGIMAKLERESKRWQKTNNAHVAKWGPYKICKLADCLEWYLQYQMLCDYTHVAFSSLNPLTEKTRGNILHQSAYAGANTLHEYRKYVDRSRRKQHRKEASENVALIKRMVNDGSYDRSRWEIGPLRC